jgi:ABC-2 type transport system permease protein
MVALLKKEISSFLNSLMGYMFLIGFLFVNGFFLWRLPVEFNILDFGYASLGSLFAIAPFVFLFLIPAITMRMFAEERRSGTIELILTKPLTELEIILAKYLAGLVLVLFSLIPTLIYFITVYRLGQPVGNIDIGGTWGSYMGLFLLGAGFIAIGLFASSVSDNQIVAFILGVFLCGMAYIGFELVASMALFGRFDLFIESLGINAHYNSMSRGVIDTRDLIYFLSIISIFLILSRMSVESRNWEEGTRRNIRASSLIRFGLGLVIIILLNVIGSFLFTRFDLTTEKRYSLSDATKELLRETPDIVYFKIYLEGDFPAGFKRLSKSTREILDEFRAYSNKIQYEFINPSKAGTGQEVNNFYQELIRKGLNPTDLQVKTSEGSSQQIIFPGAIVSYRSRELPLELLLTQIGQSPEEILNNSVQALEYNISSMIRKLTSENKPPVAFIEGHGELEAIYEWDITNALTEFYQVERIRIDEKISSLTARDTLADGQFLIRNKFAAIIIAQPDSAFSEKDKFIIDQYIMHGGKVLWLIDPVYATMDSLENSNQTIGLGLDLNLDDMLFNYGVRLNPDLILDLNALPIRVVTGMIGNQPQIDFKPWYYSPVIFSRSRHPVVNNLNAILTTFVSSLDTVGSETVKKTVLLASSDYSRTFMSPVLIDLSIIQEEPDERLFNQAGIPMAVLLEGTFRSVFSNRIPPQIQDNPLIGFRETSTPTAMIVVSDGDVIRNQLHVSQGYPLPLGFDQYTRQQFGNRDFILNAVNYLCDDSGLIAARSKDIRLRILDSTKISKSRLMIQTINIALPVVIVILFGIIQYFLRKRKYARQ